MKTVGFTFLNSLTVCLALMAPSAFAQPFYSEVLIGDPQADESPGMIDGIDDYQIDRYSGFDRTTRPQRQEEASAQEPSGDRDYWQFYRNDYDSYQEIQNERFIQWQKRVGIRPQRY